MTRQYIFTNRLWLVVLLLGATWLTAQRTQAQEPILSSLYATAYHDINGDGENEIFTIKLTQYEDGTAVGGFQAADRQMVAEAGSTACVDGEAVAKFGGTLYRIENGDLVAIGPITVSAQAGGGGGDGDITDLLFDIVDSVTARASGSLFFAVDPCA